MYRQTNDLNFYKRCVNVYLVLQLIFKCIFEYDFETRELVFYGFFKFVLYLNIWLSSAALNYLDWNHVKQCNTQQEPDKLMSCDRSNMKFEHEDSWFPRINSLDLKYWIFIFSYIPGQIHI